MILASLAQYAQVGQSMSGLEHAPVGTELAPAMTSGCAVVLVQKVWQA